MLKDAHERGENIVDPEDVITVLTGRSLQSMTRNDSIPEPSISLASDILKRATDVVYSEVDAGGIELIRRLLRWKRTIGNQPKYLLKIFPVRTICSKCTAHNTG